MKKIAIVLLLSLTSCHWINTKLGLQDDNAGEQIIEEVLDDVVQYETGYKPEIDLTPNSPEKK